MESEIKHSSKKAALGRGLGSLLGNSNLQTPPPNQEAKIPQAGEIKAEEGTSGRIFTVPVEDLAPREDQPRKTFSEEALLELSTSIKNHGIIQPILVQPGKGLKNGARFEIIAGERRWRAAQKAELKEVPIIIKDVSTTDSMEMALVENIQRQDLSPIEEAFAYQHLMEKFQYTQQTLSDRLGKDRASIANTLRLLNLPEEIRTMLANRQISFGQAKIILSVQDNQDRLALAKKTRDEKLTVRELEKLAKLYELRKKAQLAPPNPKKKEVKDIEAILKRKLATKVQIQGDENQGKLVISFHSAEELNALIERIQ